MSNEQIEYSFRRHPAFADGWPPRGHGDRDRHASRPPSSRRTDRDDCQTRGCREIRPSARADRRQLPKDAARITAAASVNPALTITRVGPRAPRQFILRGSPCSIGVETVNAGDNDDVPVSNVEPHRDWRRGVGAISRVLIAVGVLVLGFVVYQLWGTGIEHASAQRDLRQQFEQQLSSTVPEPPNTGASRTPSTSLLTATTVVTTTVPMGSPTTGAPTTVVSTAAPTTAASTTTAPPTRPVFASGEPVARLEIPRIGLDQIVVAGVGVDELKKGPGHYPQTPLPGEHGNAAIAGHRTTYGAPFFDIDQLAPGDELITTTYAGRFVYRMTGATVVSPSDVSVLADTPGDRITLTSCEPKYSATNRIVVTAELDPSASSPIAAPIPDMTTPPLTTTTPATTTPPATTAPPVPTAPAARSSPDSPPHRVGVGGVTTVVAPDLDAPPQVSTRIARSAPAVAGPTGDGAIGGDWFDDTAAWPHVLGWGFLGTAVALAALRLRRRSGRWWLGWLVGAGPIVVLLYFFYENVARLLPPGL